MAISALEAYMNRLVAANARERQRFGGITSRCVEAIATSNTAALTEILTEATKDETNDDLHDSDSTDSGASSADNVSDARATVEGGENGTPPLDA